MTMPAPGEARANHGHNVGTTSDVHSSRAPERGNSSNGNRNASNSQSDTANANQPPSTPSVPELAEMIRSVVGASQLVLAKPANPNFKPDQQGVDFLCNQILLQANWLERTWLAANPYAAVPMAAMNQNYSLRKYPHAAQSPVGGLYTNPSGAKPATPHEAVLHNGAREFPKVPQDELDFADKLRNKLLKELKQLASERKVEKIASKSYSELKVYEPMKSNINKDKTKPRTTQQTDNTPPIGEVDVNNLSLLSSLVSGELAGEVSSEKVVNGEVSSNRSSRESVDSSSAPSNMPRKRTTSRCSGESKSNREDASTTKRVKTTADSNN